MRKQERLFNITNYLFPSIILALSILSATGLCMGGCSAISDYRLFGTSFAVGGTVFAILLLIGVYLTARLRQATWAIDLMVAAGLGAEIYFVAIQKLVVKKWCPICLTIAVILVLFAFTRGAKAYSYRDTPALAGMSHGAWFLHLFGKAVLVVLVVFLGFMIAIVSVGKKQVPLSAQARELEAAATQMTQHASDPLSTADIWFGNNKSSIDVYIVTDWYCNYCREIEPVVESVLPILGKVARYTWIDVAIHQESMNLIPYGLHFLLNDKRNYLEARHVMQNLAKDGKPVSDHKIRLSLEAAGIRAPQIEKGRVNVLFVDSAIMCKAYGITQTPSVIIFDTASGKHQVLTGTAQITRENLMRIAKEGEKNGK